jgi:hypothetical protein
VDVKILELKMVVPINVFIDRMAEDAKKFGHRTRAKTLNDVCQEGWPGPYYIVLTNDTPHGFDFVFETEEEKTLWFLKMVGIES